MGIYEQAQQLADLRFNPQQDAVNRRLAQIQQGTQTRNQFADVQGQKARQYVGDAYNILDQSLAGNKEQAMGSLNTAANQIGQGFRDANAVNEAARNSSRAYMEQLMQQTGLSAGVQARQGELEGLADNLFAANTNRDAHHTANLRNWAGQAGSIYDAQIGTGKQMRASSMSDIERSILDLISQNNLSGAEQETDMGDELMKLLGERGAYFGEQVNELGQQEWMRELEQAKLQQQADQVNAELSLRAADMADNQAARSAAASRETGQWQAELDFKQRAQNQGQLNADREFERGGQQFAAGNDLDWAKLQASLQGGGQDPFELVKWINEDGGTWRDDRIGQLIAAGLMDAPPGYGQSPPPGSGTSATSPASRFKGLSELRALHAASTGNARASGFGANRLLSGGWR